MSDQAPHIIWIFCDQLRWDALGFTGNEIVETPNLDRLAAAGTVFEQAYIQVPVCMPSRATMLCSRYLRNVGMANGSPLMPPSQVTIAEWLQRHGYTTAHSGKLHLTPQQYIAEHFKSEYPMDDAEPFLEDAGLPPMPDDPAKRHYGFQHLFAHEDSLQGPWADWLAERNPELAKRGRRSQNFMQRPYAGTLLSCAGVSDLPVECHPSTCIAEKACEMFDEHHADKPLFLSMSFVDPHHPFDPPADVAATYPPERIPLPKYQDWGELKWPEWLEREKYHSPDVTDEMTKTTIGYYYAMVDVIDQAVGKLIETVEAAGQWENTIWAFVADHGELLGSYGLWKKGSFHYDCMLRTPSFISAPGRLEGGRRITGLTQAIDIAPTLLGLADLPIYEGMQGTNYAPALRAGTPIGRDWVYTEMYTGAWGPFYATWTLRTPTAKLNFFPEDGWGHLFDLEADPDERHDLWNDPAHRDLRDQMTSLLLQAQYAQADPLPRLLSQY